MSLYCPLLLSITDNTEVRLTVWYLYTHIFVEIQTFFSQKHLCAGKLEKGAVLKAICAGFEETTEPAVCLSDGMFVTLLKAKCLMICFCIA